MRTLHHMQGPYLVVLPLQRRVDSLLDAVRHGGSLVVLHGAVGHVQLQLRDVIGLEPGVARVCGTLACVLRLRATGVGGGHGATGIDTVAGILQGRHHPLVFTFAVLGASFQLRDTTTPWVSNAAATAREAPNKGTAPPHLHHFAWRYKVLKEELLELELALRLAQRS